MAASADSWLIGGSGSLMSRHSGLRRAGPYVYVRSAWCVRLSVSVHTSYVRVQSSGAEYVRVALVRVPRARLL